MPRKNLVLFLILIALAAGGYFLTRGLPWRKEALLFPEFKKDSVNKISIKAGEEAEVILEKKDSQWLVPSLDNAPANTDRVDDVLRTTTELAREELVSENSGKQASLKVDATGTCVRLFQDDKALADYYIGQIGPDFYSTYVRKEGEDQVYLVAKVLSSVVQPLDWRNLAVFNFNSNEVKSFTMESGEQSFAVEKKDDSWTAAGADTEVDSEKVRTILLDLANLKAEDINMKVSLDEAGLTNPARKYSASLNLGSPLVLSIGGQSENGKYYAKTNLSEVIYVLSAETVDSFPESAEDLQST